LKESQITHYFRYWEFPKPTHKDSILQDLSLLRQLKAASVARVPIKWYQNSRWRDQCRIRTL